MKLLLKLFIDICLLRAKPQDVPASNLLMFLTLLAVVLTGVPVIMGSVGGLAPALMIGLLDVVMILVLLQLSLGLMKLSSRMLQTSTAIFGTGVITNLLSLPVQSLLTSSAQGSVSQFLGALFYFALLVWSVLIVGHILRHSFNLQLSSGVLIAMGYFMLVNTLVRMFLPAG